MSTDLADQRVESLDIMVKACRGDGCWSLKDQLEVIGQYLEGAEAQVDSPSEMGEAESHRLQIQIHRRLENS